VEITGVKWSRRWAAADNANDAQSGGCAADPQAPTFGGAGTPWGSAAVAAEESGARLTQEEHHRR